MTRGVYPAAQGRFVAVTSKYTVPLALVGVGGNGTGPVRFEAKDKQVQGPRLQTSVGIEIDKWPSRLQDLVAWSCLAQSGLTPISPKTARYSHDLIRAFQTQIVVAEYSWESPIIASEGDGDVTLEWISSRRRFSVHVVFGAVEYLKSWGHRILDDMEGGTISDAQILPHWLWYKGISQ